MVSFVHVMTDITKYSKEHAVNAPMGQYGMEICALGSQFVKQDIL